MSATVHRLPARPSPRPVEASEEQPVTVGEAVGFSLTALTDRANVHPNVVKMHDAIDRWLVEANEREGQAGIDFLARCTARIEQNFQNLSDAVTGRATLIPALDGLTVGDLDSAHERVNRAVSRLKEGRPA